MYKSDSTGMHLSDNSDSVIIEKYVQDRENVATDSTKVFQSTAKPALETFASASRSEKAASYKSNSRNTNVDSNENPENTSYIANHDIISGSANFTLNYDDIEKSQHDAMALLEKLSLPDITEDELVTSTPANMCPITDQNRYKKLIIHEDTSVVIAQLSMFGTTNVQMHLADNQKSEVFNDLFGI